MQELDYYNAYNNFSFNNNFALFQVNYFFWI